MAQTAGFLAAAVAVGGAAKFAALPTPVAAVLAFVVFGLCLGVSSLLKVDVPKIAPKAKKVSKKEKRAVAAAAAAEKADDIEDAAKIAKATKKRDKERAKKAAKKLAATAAEQEKLAASLKKDADEKAAQVKVETAKPVAKELNKKQRQKANKKAKEAAAAAAAAGSVQSPAQTVTQSNNTQSDNTQSNEVVDGPQDTWEEVKVKKGKRKEVVTTTSSVVFSADIFVERKHFGDIIGKGGSVLQSIIDATGTEIELPKEGGMRHEILISGPTQEACNTAKKAIHQLVSQGYSDITHAGTVNHGIDVPEKKRGLLIGPGGSTIHALQDKLNVKINMPEKGSGDDVSVVGDEKEVKECIVAIKQLIAKGYSSITHDNWNESEIEVARDDLRKIIGVGGSVIKELERETGCKINIPSDVPGETCFVTVVGEQDAVAECRLKIAELTVPDKPKPVPAEWSQAASLASMAQLDSW